MLDIEFDITTREVVTTAPPFSGNFDFATTDNPSVQNGGNILYSRCANPLAPMIGIGILEVMGSNNSKVAYEMNRWQAMTTNDGAVLAKWTATNTGGNNTGIDIKQDYL
jgi:hypothetical protein